MWRKVSVLNARHMQRGLGPAWSSVALADLYVRLVATGVIQRPEVGVLVHGRARDPYLRRPRHRGRQGPDLRAAIEAHDQGARTALICKSLLGKAHTVMAEGGIAAAMGGVYPDDSWRVHFRDTMRRGKMLNSWRMAPAPRPGGPRPGVRAGGGGRCSTAPTTAASSSATSAATASPAWPTSATAPAWR